MNPSSRQVAEGRVDDAGSVTIWMLGLAFALLTLGVLSVDLWMLIGERRELASVADAAALAAASAVDEAAWRAGDGLQLVPAVAEARAWKMIGSGVEGEVDLDLDGVTVRVFVRRRVETALLGLAGRSHVTVGASSQATATLRD